MKDNEIADRLRQIDALQGKLTDLITEIEDSGHPQAEALAADLWEQCWFAASAEHVGVQYLNKKRWALQLLSSGTYGGLVSRMLARKMGWATVDD